MSPPPFRALKPLRWPHPQPIEYLLQPSWHKGTQRQTVGDFHRNADYVITARQCQRTGIEDIGEQTNMYLSLPSTHSPTFSRGLCLSRVSTSNVALNKKCVREMKIP